MITADTDENALLSFKCFMLLDIEQQAHSRQMTLHELVTTVSRECAKGKASPYSITEHMVPELIPVLGSQPAGDVSHKPGGRLPLLSARPAVTLATLNRAATNFAAWWTEARWV